MSKKIMILFSMVFINMVFSFTNWETGNSLQQTWKETKVVEVALMGQASANDINGILIRFCNAWEDNLSNELTLPIKQWEKQEICLFITNNNVREENVLVTFAPWVPIDIWWWSCGDRYTKDNWFYDYLTPTREWGIKVPAYWKVIKKVYAQFPIWINWLKRWCVAYAIAPTENEIEDQQKAVVAAQGGGVITLNIRKISLLNFFVSDLTDIKWDITTNISTSFDDNKNLILSLWIKNSFPIDETITISWVVSNIFWYRQEFTIDKSTISANWEINPTSNIGQIARYKWLFSVKININYKPYFNFDTSSSWIDPKLLEEETTTITKSFFIFPTIPAIWLLIFIVLIYLAFFRKPKAIVK